ncbi:MAG TPA: BsuBI/PstI family type II restriction endonuclease [Chthoniobacterales bacterium]
MPAAKPGRNKALRKQRLAEAVEILTALEFGPKQRNDAAGYTLLALCAVSPETKWAEASAPLLGIVSIMEFAAQDYAVHYAPNTREQIRDDAVKPFVSSGLLLKNPDDPSRPITSQNTVYQLEPAALALIRQYGEPTWPQARRDYLSSREAIKRELTRARAQARLPVMLPGGEETTLSPGGQNPLIKAIVESFRPIFAPGSAVFYLGDAESKFVHMEAEAFSQLGVELDPAAKIPDVIFLRSESKLAPPRRSRRQRRAYQRRKEGGTQTPVRRMHRWTRIHHSIRDAVEHAKAFAPHRMGVRGLDRGKSRAHDPFQR